MATAKIFALGMMLDWPSASITVQGEKLYGITKISYKQTRNKENNYGSNPYAVGRGRGRVEAEGSITIYAEEYARLQELAPDGDITQIPFFDIPVTYFNENLQEITHVLKNVEFKEMGIDVSEGDTKILMEIPLILSHIDFNQ